MALFYTSGAFIQQSFAAHRLCLSVKKVGLPDKILLSCSACNLLHRLTLRSLTARRAQVDGRPGEESVERAASVSFADCFASHPAALAMSEMDVVQDRVGLRCADCRLAYDMDVALFETHQR
jgi:hypothetical protein